MDTIGAEVGQKMRSAIKAKLMELDCYVDDELPDYIMVMVANRRTKSQMNEDLNLFLTTKTSTFVNWLHIVLKKLKEVTVTNPDVYKKAIKRKSSEVPPDDKASLKLKKEKNHKKLKKESQEETDNEPEKGSSSVSDTSETANKMGDTRKIIIGNDKNTAGSENIDDNFDIPLLSEVSESTNEQELQDIEKKIKSVKSRLGLLVESDNEDQEINFKTEDTDMPSEFHEMNSLTITRQINVLESESRSNKDADNSNIFKSSSDRVVELENKRSDNEATESAEKKPRHERITFQNDPEPRVSIKSRLDRSGRKVEREASRDRFRDRSRDRFRDKSPPKNSPGKKPSILKRLGKRLNSPDRFRTSSVRDRDRSDRMSERDRRKRSDSRDRKRSRSRDKSPLRSRDRNKEIDQREAILSRLGVQSKVSVIKKPAVPQQSDSEEEDQKVVREVQSAIKVKPRVLPTGKGQPNKNLLLKAMADAHRSVAQTPKVGKDVKEEPVFTNKFLGKQKDSIEKSDSSPNSRRQPERRDNKLREIIKKSSSRMRSGPDLSSDDEYDSDGEDMPKSVRKREKERDVPDNIPPSKHSSESESRENGPSEIPKQQFIITLDGIDKLNFADKKIPAKSRIDNAPAKKSSPSPIVFDKSNNMSAPPETKVVRSNIPDTLPVVQLPLTVKHKERCRYWPGCRQGDKCEFAHPSKTCQMFPLCKYGDKCLYLHPKCKFATSCTKRECPFDHNSTKTIMSSKVPVSTASVQNCKFFPNCSNASCPFYHPKPCKFGKYCKNMAECGFSHSLLVSKKNLSWKSKSNK